MANGDCGRGEELECRGEELECDGSDLDLVRRFNSIRCHSWSSSSSIAGISLDLEECQHKHVDEDCQGNLPHLGNNTLVIEKGCHNRSGRENKVQKTARESCTIDSEPTCCVHVSVCSVNPKPVSSDSTVDISCDQRISLRKLGQRKPFKRKYWEIILKPDNEGDNLIFIAILSDKFDLCFQLLTLIPSQTLIRARRNNMFQTALHLAALTDNAKLVRRFLVAGVQVDGQDRFGNTALHIACKRENMVVADALLQPVRYEETQQNIYEVSYQKIPQNLEVRNYEGHTCFMIAAMNGDTAMMELLISKHADINVKDIKSGMTCIHFAAESGDEKIVKYLLANSKTDINARTYVGFTALDIANIRGHSFIAYKLLCAGAKPELKSLNSLDFLAESDSDDKDSN